MTHFVKDWLEEFKKQNPENFALFARAIVGELGLTIQWNNPDGTKGQSRYKKGDTLQICEIIGENTISVSVGLTRPCILHKDHFKGFTRKVEIK